MELEKAFEAAAGRISSGQVKPTNNDDLLTLYGLHAVIAKGQPPAKRPSPYLDPRGYAKWKSWMDFLPLERGEAMRRYIDRVQAIASNSSDANGCQNETGSGFGNDAALKGFQMDPLHNGGGQSSVQRFDITHWASINDSKSVRFCLENQGVSPDYRDEDGLTALMRAADRNATDVIRMLVAAGANLNATDPDGQTALHYAALCDHARAASILVTSGSNADIADIENQTPRDIAGSEALAAIEAALCGKVCDAGREDDGRRSNLLWSWTSIHVWGFGGSLVVVLIGIAVMVRLYQDR